MPWLVTGNDLLWWCECGLKLGVAIWELFDLSSVSYCWCFASMLMRTEAHFSHRGKSSWWTTCLYYIRPVCLRTRAARWGPNVSQNYNRCPNYSDPGKKKYWFGEGPYEITPCHLMFSLPKLCPPQVHLHLQGFYSSELATVNHGYALTVCEMYCRRLCRAQILLRPIITGRVPRSLS